MVKHATVSPNLRGEVDQEWVYVVTEANWLGEFQFLREHRSVAERTGPEKVQHFRLGLSQEPVAQVTLSGIVVPGNSYEFSFGRN